MRAGKLIRRFTLERPSDPNSTVSYATVTTLWGSISGLSGIESPAIQASADHRIQIRFRQDLSVRDRLHLGDRVFEIVSSVDPDGKQRSLHILAREMV